MTDSKIKTAVIQTKTFPEKMHNESCTEAVYMPENNHTFKELKNTK